MAFLKKSEYFESLMNSNKDVAARYMDKIRVIQGIDPFCLLSEETSTYLGDFPPITAFEIVNYLILTHNSFYTKKQMGAYKSLAAYKYFEAGFVHNCESKKIGDHIVVIGKVKHSQRMNEAPLRVWIICQLDGAINSAHCTCMAGQSEVCSHVAALMYAIEYINKSQCNISSTDVKAKWVTPALTNVPIVKLSELNLKMGSKQLESTSQASSQTSTIRPIEGIELQTLLRKIKDDGDDAVLLRVVEPFATEESQEMSNISCVLPNTYNLYKEEYELLAYADLCDLARQIDESIDEEQRQHIQLSTVHQNQSNEWFKQRVGRITGSTFKRVCQTSISRPSLSTIKTICYPLNYNFKSKATEWGLQHEKQALKAYELSQSKMLTNLQMHKVGLCIDKENPFLAASPDSIVSCDCCGSGCIEIKCPYLLRDSNFRDYCNQRNSFLEEKDNNIYLKRSHSHYYQVQLQLKVTKSQFCDFVVWWPKDLFVERIYYDEEFWVRNFPIAYDFHKKVVLPELLGKYFTKSKHLNQRWCLCQSINDDRLMIQCENDCCEIQWFHLECIGLSDIPKELWLCRSCSNQGQGSSSSAT